MIRSAKTLLAACLLAVAPLSQAQVNVGGFAQQNFKNVSGAPANDFHVDFQVPTLGLGQDVATATPYPFATGPATTFNFALAPPIANNNNFQLTYAPGGIPIIFANLVSANFTFNGAAVATRGVSIFDLFSFVPGTSPSEVFASTQFSNQESTAVVLNDLSTVTNIPIEFFTFEDFASGAAIGQGTSVPISSSLTLAPGLGDVIDLGTMEIGTYALIMGTASVPDVSDAFPFAFAAQAIPEPSSFILFAVGLVPVGVLALRRRRLA